MSQNMILWEKAPDIGKRARTLIKILDLTYIKPKNLHYYRSYNSKAHARARIWGLQKLWQSVLKVEPQYIIEVISEKYDNLSIHNKDEILIHELMHIPKNFSGSLVPHYKKNKKRNFNNRVDKLFKSLLKNS